jgi:hypothetical protein
MSEEVGEVSIHDLVDLMSEVDAVDKALPKLTQ